LGRTKSVAIGPHGSCCRQYAGKEGFWFEKNLTHLHRQWPEVFPEKFVRERCVDHLSQPTNKRDEALEFCQRRKNEIARLVENAKVEPTTLLPDDAEALGTALANGVALTLHRHIALPEVPTEKMIRLREWQEAQEKAPVDVLIDNPEADWGEVLNFLMDPELDEIDGAFAKALSKSGSRLTDESKATAKLAFTAAIERWTAKAAEEKRRGAIRAPKPEKPAAVISIDRLCEISQKSNGTEAALFQASETH
jgi:hypothetical protein